MFQYFNFYFFIYIFYFTTGRWWALRRCLLPLEWVREAGGGGGGDGGGGGSGGGGRSLTFSAVSVPLISRLYVRCRLIIQGRCGGSWRGGRRGVEGRVCKGRRGGRALYGCG